MSNLSKKKTTQAFVQIPVFPTDPPTGGLESRRIIEQLDALATVLDEQANTLDDWREAAIGFLLRPLVDDHDDMELTGDEYEKSTMTQDEVVVYVQALRAVIADRNDALSGLDNQLIAHDVKAALRVATKGEGPHPTKTLELFRIRLELKPTKEMGSVRGIVSDLRALATSLRNDAENGNARAQNELNLVEKQLKSTQKQLSEQTKATTALEKELDLFVTLMNTRLEYYRQLQAVSDMVDPYEGILRNKVILTLLTLRCRSKQRHGHRQNSRK